MTTNTYVSINGSVGLFSGPSPDSAILALFSEGERKGHGYRAGANVIRDRLQARGFTGTEAAEVLTLELERWHAEHNRVHSSFGILEQLDGLTSPLGIKDLLVKIHDSVNRIRPASYLEVKEILDRVDARWVLRLMVNAISESDRAAAEVEYVLHDTGTPGSAGTLGGLADAARKKAQSDAALGLPLVVLTEGSSDGYRIREAIRVLRPHLLDFIKFMVFGDGVPGGAGHLPRLAQSLVGAQVTNRFIILADNDSAGRGALANLTDLPDNFRISYYPDVPLLNNYPTRGPQSDKPVRMNVNGKAGSLEMYFGFDVLRTRLAGALPPIEWAGYQSNIKQYQGALSSSDKARVTEKYKKKVKSALADRRIIPSQDWAGMNSIIDLLLAAFDQPREA